MIVIDGGMSSILHICWLLESHWHRNKLFGGHLVNMVILPLAVWTTMAEAEDRICDREGPPHSNKTHPQIMIWCANMWLCNVYVYPCNLLFIAVTTWNCKTGRMLRNKCFDHSDFFSGSGRGMKRVFNYFFLQIIICTK